MSSKASRSWPWSMSRCSKISRPCRKLGRVRALRSCLFEEGVTSFAPGGGIDCCWDELENPRTIYREGRMQRGIEATVDYQDIAGDSYIFKF